MAKSIKAKPGAKPSAEERLLERFTPEQREEILTWMEEPEALSYPDAAARATQLFGSEVKPWEVWHYADKHLLARRFARSLFAASSLAGLSDEQRAILATALDDKIKLRLDALVDSSLRGKPGSDEALARLRSTVDSCEKTRIAKANHELNVKADRRAEKAIVLQAQEQARKGESLKLEREKFEAATRIKDKVRDLAERAGLTAEERDEFERDLKIL